MENLNFSNTPEGIKFSLMFEKHTKRFLSFCGKISRTNEGFIDEGMSAKVFFAAKNEKYCVKIIKENQEENAVQTSVEKELEMLERAYTQCGDFVPEPILFFESDEGYQKEVFLMRAIDGVTIKKVLSGDAILPKSYDYQKFFAILTKQVEKLHEAGIYHRDLHAGNVMVDNNTGLPKIIDFGASVLGFGNDEENYTLRERNGVVRKLLNDESAVKKLQKEMRGIV